jgi:quercetin dioxygenase-like cupin family protein
VPGYFARFIHTDNMSFIYWNVKAGAFIHEHAHIHEQVAHVFEGTFELTVNGRPYS